MATEIVHVGHKDIRGCIACGRCGDLGRCVFNDEVNAVAAKLAEADGLVVGSPIYCGYPTANLRAFMERLIFPGVNYSDFRHPVVNKPKRSATIYTMNCTNMETYKANDYDILMDVNANQLGMFGPTEILYSFDTYQFSDYSRYDAAQIDGEHKAEIHRTQFPKDLEKAYELGRRLVKE